MEKYEHGGNVYSDGNVEDWLDFSANINPLGLSELVKTAITDNIDGLIHYPDPSMLELKSSIAARYGIATKNIIGLNGAAEFFYLFFNVIKPASVLIPVPSFSEYERAANCNIKYLFPDNEKLKINIARLIEVVKTAKIESVIIGRPNNPTGEILSLNDVIELLQVTKYLVLDESFIDFIEIESARKLIYKYENLIVVQSLTKFYAIPGLRLGFAAAAESLVKHLEQGKDVWNVNYLAQKAGVAALSDENYMVKTRRWIESEKLYIIDKLKMLPGVDFIEPTVNFVLLKFETEELANYILNELRNRKILMRSCANFTGLDGRYVRMAIRSRAENDKLINLLGGIINGQINAG